MSDFQIEAMVISGVLATIVGAVITVLSLAEVDRPGHYGTVTTIARRKQFAFGIGLSLFGWLWGPWLGFCIWWTACQSVNGIDYLQRPPQVIPADRQVVNMNLIEKK